MFLSETSTMPRELSIWKADLPAFLSNVQNSSKWYVFNKHLREWMVWSPFLFLGVFNCQNDLGIIQLLKDPSYSKSTIRKKAFLWPETSSSRIIFPSHRSSFHGKMRHIEQQKVLQLWDWDPGHRCREGDRPSRLPSLSCMWVPQQVRCTLFSAGPNFWFLFFCGKLKRKLAMRSCFINIKFL